VKIALDAMGGDLAPQAVIEGALMAARDFQIDIVLVGDRDVIVRELGGHDAGGLPITIEHAAEAVAMDESPLESVLGKPESSIHIGLELVKRGQADAFVSAGNSGAMMAAAMAILGNLPGVDRPAIASLMPATAGLALLIDAGANTEVKPVNLMQFGVMGSVYWKHVYNTPEPRVAILSNGEEASKGTELTRAAAAALLQMAPHVNYIGYVEGRDLNRAKADVVVTDGFTGNVALKTMEGFAAFLLGNLREVFESGWLRKIAYLLVRKKLRAIRERLDPAEYGGAPLLGVNGVAIIAHGSSSARAIRNAVRAAANEALVRQVNAEIVEVLSKAPETLATRPAAGKGIRGIFSRMRDRLHLHRDGHADKSFADRERPPAEKNAEKRGDKVHPDRPSADKGPTGALTAPAMGPDKPPEKKKLERTEEPEAAEQAAPSEAHPPRKTRPTGPIHHDENIADAAHGNHKIPAEPPPSANGALAAPENGRHEAGEEPAPAPAAPVKNQPS
jgi:glycerol-3-phosphate acyltransferase PlsX